MQTVFADTVYWVAIVKPNDAHAEAAWKAHEVLGPCIIVTTDEVLSEFVTLLARGGPMLRQKAVETVRTILKNPNVRVVPQSRDSFLRALDRFSKRPDKEYSLTDCSSMNLMDMEGIRDVLTLDHHFEQEGFALLMRSAPSDSR